MISSVRVRPWHLDLDDRRQDLLVEDVFAGSFRWRRRSSATSPDSSSRTRRPRLGQRRTHLLDIAKPHADAGPAELDGETRPRRLDSAADVVGLHLFGAAAMYARRFMRHARIGKRAAHHARPRQLDPVRRRRWDRRQAPGRSAARIIWKIFRTVRTRIGLRCSWLRPLKQA